MTKATKDYSRGYAAGRRKTAAELEQYRALADAISSARGSLWNQAYLALLPAAMQVSDWVIGEEKITSGEQRVRLAKLWADKAVKNMAGFEP